MNLSLASFFKCSHHVNMKKTCRFQILETFFKERRLPKKLPFSILSSHSFIKKEKDEFLPSYRK